MVGIRRRGAESDKRASSFGAHPSVPYKKAAASRRWITGEEIEVAIEGCPKKSRDKLLYEFDKIGLPISALRKKHP
jgi:hypothetical protein